MSSLVGRLPSIDLTSGAALFKLSDECHACAGNKRGLPAGERSESERVDIAERAGAIYEDESATPHCYL